MNKDDLSARLFTTFLAELADQVRALNEGFLALERDPTDVEALKSVFRSAHTVKGAARVAGVPAVEQICHALETRIADIRDRKHQPTPKDFADFFAVVDRLTAAAKNLRTQTPASAPQAQAPKAPAPAPVPTPVPAPVPVNAPTEMARVPAPKLDQLVNQANEVLIATGRLEATQNEWREVRRTISNVKDATGLSDVLRTVDRLMSAVDRDIRQLARHNADLNASAHSLRLRRFGDVSEALPRAARDVGAAEGKSVEFELFGENVEADRVVMDALREPLLHLTRNAISHGLETPAERRAAGKSETGSVRVGAALRAGKLVVTVSDDGRGLNTDAVRKAMRAKGIDAPATDAKLARAIFRAGVSTAAQTTAVSGRGVGLDVARAALERIGGSIDVEWQAGAGTTFILECPPSPALMRVILARVDNHTVAFPITQVQKLIRIKADQLKDVNGRTVIETSGAPMPVAQLATLLGPPLRQRAIESAVHAIVLSVGTERAAVTVDDIIGDEVIVMRPLDEAGTGFAMGGALLPSGRVALVLNGALLLHETVQGSSGAGMRVIEPEITAQRRILIVDDSITTRTLEQSVLEAAGYHVTTAVDGQDAWERLDKETFDAVVSDLEMPRMNGLELCAQIRASKRFKTMPVILVTGRESEEDRAMGLEAGADAYIVKSTFDHNTLLGTLKSFIA